MASSGNVVLRYVSVINDEDIEIVVFAADSIDYRSLFLFKSDDGKITFSKIDAKSKINAVENYYFTDNNVDVHQHTYYYTVAITDECDHIFTYSDTGNNVVLEIKNSPNDEISVEWQPYYGFKSRLDNYDILRRTQTETVSRPVNNVPPTKLDYDENVWNSASNGGKFYYQVVANEDNTNIYGFQDKSYSNIVEIVKEAITYIPNMFSPNSQIAENKIFKPVNSYVDMEEYVFSIYDRWGSLIFSTNDIKAGWDGTVNGKPAAAGVYAYILIYRLDKKTMYKKQGHVTLIW
jgi:gliding motility-associated-like protein